MPILRCPVDSGNNLCLLKLTLIILSLDASGLDDKPYTYSRFVLR